MESEIFGYRFLSWLATCIVEKIRQYSNLETTQFPPVTGRDTLVSSWCNCHIFAALDARYDPTNSDNLHKSTRYLGAANLKKVNWGKLKLPRNCFYSAMATQSSTLAWKIPWMEEPGRLQSLGSLRVGGAPSPGLGHPPHLRSGEATSCPETHSSSGSLPIIGLGIPSPG